MVSIRRAALGVVAIALAGGLTESAAVAQSFRLTSEISPSGAGLVQPGDSNYVAGTKVTLLATANNGFRFDHWELDASGSSASVQITMSADRTVRAVFMPAYHLTVTVTPAGAGTVTSVPPAGIVDAGQTVMLTAMANAGFRFVEWRGAAGGATTSVSVLVQNDTSVTAVFLPLYMLTTAVGRGQGAILVSPSKPVYDAGEPFTMTAVPAEGYRFARWSGDIDSQENPLTISLDRNLTVLAEFESCPFCNTCGVGAGPAALVVSACMGAFFMRRRRSLRARAPGI